ncbi:CD1247 N-terminal domain-containing protein [Peptoniphilus obesi]|uniref:CD1247 N-terminal domain-containing protein n=1 Tax=Peptoniphilus obesi TaxID=1472765 RepID=UPI0004B88EEF|nr:CD1247 N-terminal domain-containing protein [Peptoniphilus obesi]
MDEIINKLSYIQGLADGYDLDYNKKEDRLLLELIDAMAEMAEVIKFQQDELNEYVDLIEEDLTNLEDYVYDEEDYDYDDFDDDDFYDDDLYADFDDCDCCSDDSCACESDECDCE